MNNLFAQATVIYGRPVTGIGMTMPTITTGCPALGSWRPKSASCGPQAIGVGVVMHLSSTKATGVRRWVFMAGSITDSVTSEWGLRADVGTMDTSSITARWPM